MNTLLLTCLIASATATKFASSNKNSIQVISGGRCFTDGPGAYRNRERAIVTVLEDGMIYTSEFNTESNYDFLTVNGVRYHGVAGFDNIRVRAGSRITWKSDYSVTRGGFTVCMKGPIVLPDPSRPGDLFVSDSPGVVAVTDDGRCFTDGKGRYNNGERAAITVLGDFLLHSEEMHTERSYDWLTINGRRYDGDRAFKGIKVRKGDVIRWRSDGSVKRHGFTVCTGERAPLATDLFKTNDAKVVQVSPDGRCFTDGHGPYQNGERVKVKVLQDGFIHSEQMNTESRYDWLTINGRRYDGKRSFEDVPVKKGSTIRWRSDGSVKRQGFIVCLWAGKKQCNPRKCSDWTCAEWCECFAEGVAYTGCDDDGEDTCQCV